MSTLAAPKRAIGLPDGTPPADALRQIRHDIRNHLNTIKLSCAILQRSAQIDGPDDSLREIERAADAINELVTASTADTGR